MNDFIDPNSRFYNDEYYDQSDNTVYDNCFTIQTYNKLKIIKFTIDVPLESPNKVWYVGNSVAKEYLGYSAPRHAIRAHVENRNKKYIMLPMDFNPNMKSKAVIINDEGVNSLLRESKTIDGKAVRRWLDNEVLPSILNNGSYVDNNNFFQLVQSRIFGVDVRNSFTSSYKYIAKNRNDFANITNKIYKAIFNHTAAELKIFAGLNPINNPSELLRGFMTPKAQMFISAVESQLAMFMSNKMYTDQLLEITLKYYSDISRFRLHENDYGIYFYPFNISFMKNYPIIEQYFGEAMSYEPGNNIDSFVRINVANPPDYKKYR